MRISELSKSAGVPVDTVKYYLRMGLLPEGRRTSATQAQYEQSHLDRLRLIRALTGVGGLSLATTRSILEVLDRRDRPASTHQLLEQVDQLLAPLGEEPEDTTRAEAVIADMGWDLKITEPGPTSRLAQALAAIDAADFPLDHQAVLDYAHVMQALADEEVASVPDDADAALVRYIVLGTILIEPLLLALRRLALINASARRYSADT